MVSCIRLNKLHCIIPLQNHDGRGATPRVQKNVSSVRHFVATMIHIVSSVALLASLYINYFHSLSRDLAHVDIQIL